MRWGSNDGVALIVFDIVIIGTIVLTWGLVLVKMLAPLFGR